MKKIPHWVITGVIIFPVLIVIGLILNAVTLGDFNILFWLIMPSIIFEELFETCCYTFSNNQLANFLFAILFWFVIGAIIGWITLKLKKK